MRVSAAYLAGRCDCPWAFMVQGVSLGRPGGMEQNQTALATFSHALLKVGQRRRHGGRSAPSCTSYCSVLILQPSSYHGNQSTLPG